MKRTISAMVGKGSVNHNSRAFKAENVDGERTEQNINYCNENIRDVYHELFDEALERYNDRQKRADRRIDDYYEKIRTSKQEKVISRTYTADRQQGRYGCADRQRSACKDYPR